MVNKDLLFMLENGEEFIKGIYKANEDKIYFISPDGEDIIEDIREYNKNLIQIYEENKIEMEILIEKIFEDSQLLDKIKNHSSNKLLFKYSSKALERILGII